MTLFKVNVKMPYFLGTTIMFHIEGGQIAISVTPSRNLFGTTDGLLGTFDNNTANDFKLKTGTFIPTNSTPSTIYSNFGNSCEDLYLNYIFYFDTITYVY